MRFPAVATIAISVLLSAWLPAQPPSPPPPAELAELDPFPPVIDLGVTEAPIRIEGGSAVMWSQGDAQVIGVSGSPVVRAPAASVEAQRLIIWFEPDAPAKLDVYGAGQPTIRDPAGRTYRPGEAYVRFASTGGVIIQPPLQRVEQPPRWDAYLQAVWQRYPELRPPPDPDRPRHVPDDLSYRADRIQFEFRDNGGVLTLFGDVRIQWAGNLVEADTIYVTLDQIETGGRRRTELKSVYAEGAVTFESGTDTLQCHRLYLNEQTREGLALDSTLRMRGVDILENFALHLPEAYRLSDDAYDAPVGDVTTSMFGDPPWRIRARSITFRRGRTPLEDEAETPPARRRALLDIPPETDADFAGERIGPAEPPPERPETPDTAVVTAWHNVFYAGRVPLFYWPYVSKDLADDRWFIKSANLGEETHFGVFLQTEWDLHDFGVFPTPWSELSLSLDYYQKRGVGFGPTFEYETDRRLGMATAYYIDDRGDLDEKGVPVPQTDRGRFLWRHREMISREWRLDLETSYLSDFNFLRTYFRDEYDNHKEQETYAYLRRLEANTAAIAVYQHRLNDFQTVVERRPSLAFHQAGQPLTEADLVWTHDWELANLRLLESETDFPDINDDATHVVRFNTAHELSRPFEAGVAKLDPFVEGHSAAWSKRAGDRSETMRGAAGYGARGAMNFHRTYDAHSSLLDVNRLRHIVTPHAEYRHLALVSKRPDQFIQHDEVDALDRKHVMRTGLRNRWLTKRGPAHNQRTELFFLLDLTQNTFVGERGANKDEEDFLEVDAEWAVTDELTLLSENNEFRTRDGRARVANARADYRRWRPLTLTYRHEYFDLPATPIRSLSTVGFTYAPEYSRWIYDFSTSYDFKGERDETIETDRDARLLGMRMRFSRKIHEWILTIDLGLWQGRDDEASISVMLLPEAFAGGS